MQRRSQEASLWLCCALSVDGNCERCDWLRAAGGCLPVLLGFGLFVLVARRWRWVYAMECAVRGRVGVDVDEIHCDCAVAR